MLKNSENIICLGLIAAASAMFLASLQFPAAFIWGVPAPDRPYQAEAGTWPRIVCVALIILCVLRLIDNRLEKQGAANTERKAPPPWADIKRALAFIAAVGAYMLLLIPLGFPVATLLFGLGMVFALDTGTLGKAKSAAVISLIGAGIIILFGKILYLPLPRGVGAFREFSQWLIF